MKHLRGCLVLLGAVVMMIAAMGGCAKKTTLDVTITSNPTGGYFVENLTCSFYGTLKGSTPITATIQWIWADAAHANQTVQKTETYTFSATGASSTTYNAQPGYVLLNYWWVKVSWTDQDGTAKSVESSEAFCRAEDAPQGSEGPDKSMLLMSSTPVEE